MMKKPARYIITGVDATGVSTPVLARVSSRKRHKIGGQSISLLKEANNNVGLY